MCSLGEGDTNRIDVHEVESKFPLGLPLLSRDKFAVYLSKSFFMQGLFTCLSLGYVYIYVHTHMFQYKLHHVFFAKCSATFLLCSIA